MNQQQLLQPLTAAPEPVRKTFAARTAVYPLSDFALDKPHFGYYANVASMKTISWLGVGLNRVWGSRAKDQIGIVTYHRVSPEYPGVPAPTHNVTPDRFRAQLKGLLDHGFTFWPLKQLLEYRREGRTVPPRTVAVTFDDGFESVYTNAWRVLRELQIPATIFVTTAYLDSEDPFAFDTWGLEQQVRVPADAYRPLSIAQCREMAAGGLIDLGAHAHTHRDLRGHPDEFQEDVQRSVDYVRERFSLQEVMFAFPYGSKQRGFSGPTLVEAAKKTGVICGLTTECSLVNLQDDPFEWGRFNAFSWDTSATLTAKLEGWYTWAFRLKQFCLGRRALENSAT